jgi:hypothetical protein
MDISERKRILRRIAEVVKQIACLKEWQDEADTGNRCWHSGDRRSRSFLVVMPNRSGSLAAESAS